MALEPVDMRLGAERLGALVRERMRAEPRSRALFVFVGKRGHSMKILTWDGTGTIVVHKKLDAGRFELSRATQLGEQHLLVSDAIFDVIHKGGVAVTRQPGSLRLESDQEGRWHSSLIDRLRSSEYEMRHLVTPYRARRYSAVGLDAQVPNADPRTLSGPGGSVSRRRS
jgi:transposase